MKRLKVKRICNFDGCFTIKSVGSRGGLCLLWKGQNLVSIKSFSRNHIDAEVDGNGRRWRFTGVYGYPEAGQKSLTWELTVAFRG